MGYLGDLGELHRSHHQCRHEGKTDSVPCCPLAKYHSLSGCNVLRTLDWQHDHCLFSDTHGQPHLICPQVTDINKHPFPLWELLEFQEEDMWEYNPVQGEWEHREVGRGKPGGKCLSLFFSTATWGASRDLVWCRLHVLLQGKERNKFLEGEQGS